MEYTLQEYADHLSEAGLLVKARMPETPLPVGYLTYDSRDLGERTLFVCKGAAFREAYLREVIERGIQAYVSETVYPDIDPAVPYLLVSDIRRAMPVLAGLFYGEAWRVLHPVGITGTKGKSTTAYYVKSILDQYLAATGGCESAIISSIDTYDGVTREESHLTTPENMDLQRHFRNAADSGITHLTMEVSSQALKCGRVDGITFEVGVYLNFSEDHISPMEHPTVEDYFASKMKLFSQTRHAVVNLDGARTPEVLEAAKAAEEVLTFSRKDAAADLFAYNVRKEEGEIRFSVRTAQFDEPFALSMPGFFNVENALAAIGAALCLGIPLEYIKEGLYLARSSGRMEVYTSRDENVVAIVDYAHNRLSFETLFSSTRIEYPEYRIVSLFGCPGKKALLRRRDLSRVAGQYADKIYIVAEDPGAEPFEDIAADIARYVAETGCPYEIIEDRGEAIRKAVLEVKEPTVLLITGKGNETRQKYGDQYLPCISDVEYTKQYLAEYDDTRVPKS